MPETETLLPTPPRAGPGGEPPVLVQTGEARALLLSLRRVPHHLPRTVTATRVPPPRRTKRRHTGTRGRQESAGEVPSGPLRSVGHLTDAHVSRAAVTWGGDHSSGARGPSPGPPATLTPTSTGTSLDT